MPVWKRFKGKKVVRGNADYNKATWIASGKVNGQTYKKALPRETVKTAEQARIEDDLIRAEIRKGEYSFLTDKTKFSEFVDSEYLPYAKDKNANYKTKVFETAALKLFFKDTHLKLITPQLCEKYKFWRKTQTVRCQKCAFGKDHICEPKLISYSTINRELTTLSAVLTRAAFLGKIKDNPMRFVERMKEPESRDRFLTADEKIRLLGETSKHYHLHFLVLTALLTGWRKGQILSLKASDMSSETRTVLLSRSKQQKPRRVSVSDMAWRIFERLATETPCDYLFFNPKTGTKYLDLKRKWNESLAAAGIENFRFHDLRRSFASDMLGVSASDLLLKNALGHSTIDTTSIYARSENEVLRTVLNAVASEQNYESYLM